MATDLNQMARKAIIACKIFIVFCVLCIVISATVKYITTPYSVYLVGIEIAIAVAIAFNIIKRNTFKPRIPYNPDNLIGKTQQVLLLENITNDMEHFESSASYFYRRVRIYKYSTMTLAGISTILLGLSFKNILPDKDLTLYTEIAKNSAFVIGAIITVYTGLMAYWNIEKYWLQNKSIAGKLLALKEKTENEDKAGKLTADEVQARFDDYQAIKADFYKYWEGALSGQSASK